MHTRTTTATDRIARYTMLMLLAGVNLIASATRPAAAIDRNYIGAAGGDWNTAANWSPFGVPSAVDIARLNGDVVNLSAATTGLDGLSMTGGSILGNQGFRILVDDVFESAFTTMTGGSLLFLTPTGLVNDMDTDNLTVSSSSIVLISGGAILDVDTTCFTFAAGAINGDGELVINGELDNSASLVASDGGFAANGGTLIVTGPGAADLDGSAGGGELVASETGSELIIGVALSDTTFAGTMKIGDLCAIELTNAVPALLVDGGTIDMQGGSFVAPSTTTTLAGDLALANGTNVIETNLVVDPSAVVTLADASTVFRSSGPLTFNGGDFDMGDGVLQPNRAMTIAGDTTIRVGILDLDGHTLLSQNEPVTIGDGVRLTIEADAIAANPSALGVFAGHLELDGGELFSSIGGGATAFVLSNGGDPTRPARLDLIDNGVGVPELGGSSTLVVGSDADLRAINRVTTGVGPLALISVETRFIAGAVDVEAGLQLELDAAVTLEGGTVFTGNGTLLFTGSARVSGGDQAVGVHVEIGDGDIIRLDAGRTLALDRGASFRASRIDNTLGAGSGTTLSLDGDSTVDAGFATAISSVATDTFDWDGTEREDRFTITSGATFIVDSPRLDGGANAYADEILIEDGGTLIVNTDDPWRLPNNLGLASAVLALAGADAVVDGQPLENDGFVLGNGQVRSAFVNEGALVPSALNDPTATLTFGASYEQRADGLLVIDVEGLADDAFDRVLVTGSASLDGTLRVTLHDGYVPPIGTTFTILEGGSIAGAFATVDADTAPGMDWSIDYGPDHVTLEVVATCADLDGNGQVGFSDLIDLLNAWGPCTGSCPEDLDASGSVGFNDVTILLNAWGACPQD